MRLISARAWLMVFFSAVLQIWMFPTGGPVSPWRCALCWIALTPFLLALTSPGKDGCTLSWRNAAALGYGCGILWFFGNCFWIYQTMYLYGGLPKPISFFILILFSLYLGLYHAIFAGVVSLFCRSRFGVRGALLFAPLAWVAVELTRARVTGFPWDLLGYTQVDNLLVTRIAPVAGVMGISLLVAAVNAGLAWGVMAPGGRRRRSIWLAACGGSALVLQLGGMAWKRPAERQDQLAVMMQENLSVGASGKEVRPLSVPEELSQFTEASLDPVILLDPIQTLTPRNLQRDYIANGGTQSERLNVVIWPEAPAHFQSEDPQFRASLSGLARLLKVPVIAGSLGVDETRDSPRGYSLYDSATLFEADGNYRGRYDKIHLVPWGEYIPFKRFFSFARKLTEGAGDMDAGRERTVFQAGNHRYGVFICYESIFGDEVREFVKNGAEVLVNISDDGWYGDTGAPWQHLNMARMRAIENHRWVLRSTNTGVTTAIDPLGRVTVEAPRHVRGAFGFAFGFEQGTTFYTRYGDWVGYVCGLVTVAGLGLSLAGKRDGRTPR